MVFKKVGKFFDSLPIKVSSLILLTGMPIYLIVDHVMDESRLDRIADVRGDNNGKTDPFESYSERVRMFEELGSPPHVSVGYSPWALHPAEFKQYVKNQERELGID